MGRGRRTETRQTPHQRGKVAADWSSITHLNKPVWTDGLRESRNACCLDCQKPPSVSLCQRFSVLRNLNCNNEATATHPELQCSCRHNTHADYNHLLKINLLCPTIFIDACSFVFICLICFNENYIFCVLFQMNLLLKEYLTSGDVLEAEHCLRDLEVPHFHHELVYEVKQEKVRCAVQNKCCSNVKSYDLIILGAVSVLSAF